MSIGFNGSVAGEGLITMDGVPKLKLDAGTPLVTLADISKRLNGPTFRALKTSATQNIAGGANTRIDFNVEDLDSAGAYNTTTNRFTPQVAGWYMVNLRKYLNNGATGQIISLDINKNGSRLIRLWFGNVAAGVSFLAHGQVMIFLNGTTDYIDASVNPASGSVLLDPDTTLDEFSAFYLRP